jgi:hypothetical protein
MRSSKDEEEGLQSRPGGVLGCDKWMKKHLNKAGEPLVRMSK